MWHTLTYFGIAAGVLLLAALAWRMLLRSSSAADEATRAAQDLDTTLQAIPDILLELDLEGRCHRCVTAQPELLNRPPARLVGQLLSDVFAPTAAATIVDAVRVASEDDLCAGPELELEGASGVRRFELSVARKLNPSVSAQRFILILRDITERAQSQARLQLAASVFTHAHEGILITDAQAAIIEVNDMFTQITGYSRAEVLGRNPSLLRSARQDKAVYAAMWRELQLKGHWSGEVWNRHQSGRDYAEMLTVSVVRDALGNVQNYVGLFTDITAIKDHEHQLQRIAHYDTLTGLANRVLLADRLRQGLMQCERRGTGLAVIYLDLDGFKAVNDTYGHSRGDYLLVTVANRMKAAMRETDTLARIGGDEFVAVLTDLAQSADCDIVLRRLLQAVAEPVRMDGIEMHVSASIGVTRYPDDPSDADHLLRHADHAMYVAKQTGKNRYFIFDGHETQTQDLRLRNLDQVYQAIARREFVLHYQPRINLASGQVTGAEALIRWNSPQGLMAPAQFRQILQEQPTSVVVGDWVLNQVLEQLTAWRAQGIFLPVSINICTAQIQIPSFSNDISQRIEQHMQVPPGSIELELPESNALVDIEHVSAVMTALKNQGVRLALDDFGTGFASLNNLRRLPVNTLKIDQSFVSGMTNDANDLLLVNAVIQMAKAFRMEVVAKGVESATHAHQLALMGCDQAQGNFFAQPLEASAFADWLERWNTQGDWKEWRLAAPPEAAATIAPAPATLH